jgi:hypothetical protein
MSLVALDGTPLVAIGQPFIPGSVLGLPGATSLLQDAAKEACIMHGHIITDDGGSHTIDTTGSSSLGWRAGAVTLANAGTTFKVGLAALDTANGPPARAANASDVITLDVSGSYTSAAAPTANAWNQKVPDSGTKTIANGDLVAFCTQMTARGGADAVNTSNGTGVVGVPRPGVTGFVGGSYADAGTPPNAVITFSDGHLGWFYGGAVFATASTGQSFNNTGTNEYGNLFQLPFPVKIYGLYAACNVAGDTDFVLYSDPLGTPASAKSVSVDLNVISTSQARYSSYLFASPYTTTANKPVAAIVKPTSATSVQFVYKTYNAAAHQVTEMCGTNGYAVNRASGAFAAQNSSKDRFAIGLLVGAFQTHNSMLVNSGELVG